MTRHKTVRPLIAAWIFVLALLSAGFVWLTLSPDQASTMAEHNPDHSTEQAAGHSPDPGQSGHDISIASALAPPEGENPENTGHGSVGPDTTVANASPNLSHEAGEQQPTTSSPSGSSISLTKAPIDGLIVMGANGPLPVLGPDSMVAWREYARPAETEENVSGEERPKIAILVTGIGLNSTSSDLAIRRLPGQIDLGFSPYGRQLQSWMDKSRAAGHEGFLMIPAEPLKYPENDPGPHTLLTGASERDNLKKLDWLLSQVTGYVGVVNDMGSKFTASEPDILPILTDLHGRGLMFLDSRSTRFSVAAKLARRISMPRALNNLYIDNIISASEIAKNLATLENTARTYGTALGVARAFPLTIEELEKWARGLEARGIQLVPITAIANRQPIR